MDTNSDTDILQICRTCIKEMTDVSFFYLDCTPVANTQLTIRQMLCSCVPELDLSIVSDAVICSKCVDNLLSVSVFKRNCLQSAIQIHKYIQQAQHTGDVNLVEVVRFHQPETMNNDDSVCDTNDFNEASACTEFTEPKYLSKLREVDMQHVLFNTYFDDLNINYNLSEEENLDTRNNIAQICLPEVIEHQDNYDKNLNKTDVYYQCHRCGQKAENKLKLILHLKRHTRKNIHHRKIISKRLSRYHKNLFYYYRCSSCNFLTKYKCLFDFHNRIHLTKKGYKHTFKHTDVYKKALHHTTIKVNKRKCVKNCKNYNKHSFKNRNKSKEYKQHFSRSLKPSIRAHTLEKQFKCSICKYQCNYKVNLKHHMRLHPAEKPFSCSVCEYQCSQKKILKQHMLIHTGEKPFSCFVCGYQCSQKSNLKQHILIHTGDKPFSCSVCGYQCSQKSSLKQHILIHTGEKPFSCSVCEYQCSQKSDLKKHMQIHTGEKPFSCSVCEYQCSRKSSLKQHILIHTGEKLFSCSVCEYQCSRKSSLKRHILIHTGEKPFSCSVCEYQCSRKYNIKRHMLIHTGEKPFSCSVCEYQCSQKSDLKKHMQIHAGEKPFSCSACEYKCSRKSSIKQHILIHTGEKPFSCSVCEYKCSKKSSLKQHILIHT